VHFAIFSHEHGDVVSVVLKTLHYVPVKVKLPRGISENAYSHITPSTPYWQSGSDSYNRQLAACASASSNQPFRGGLEIVERPFFA